MKILILPDAPSACCVVANRMAALLKARPEAVLGLATGGTMEPVYAALIAQAAKGAFCATGFTSFNLDEYVGLAPDHPQSYHHYMRTHLFAPLGLAASNTHLPRGDAPDLEAEAARYEQAITQAGGIDLQLLGIGANGHIGFNEPSSSLVSRTRVKTLTRKTVEDNRRFFAPGETVPGYALTMGIGTVMDARNIVLLATGAHKAQAVAAMVEGPVSASCPASILQMHAHATVVCDREAAGALRMTEYYETVHPEGAEPALTIGPVV